jgi:hypothetical protein
VKAHPELRANTLRVLDMLGLSLETFEARLTKVQADGTAAPDEAATRRRHRKPRDLGDHGAEAAATDPFLETRQHRFLVAGVDVDDAMGGETDLGRRP